MSIIGVRDVERADGVLRIAPGDRLTPLARERAADLGVTIEVGGRGPSAAAGSLPVTDLGDVPPPSAPSAILHRRGAPSAAARRRARGSGHAAARAVVVGAGHVGTTAALRLAEADAFDEVVLVDVIDGLAAGTALDLWHGASITGFATRIRGEHDVRDAGPADVVVITAGKARTPGMSRTDLTATNAAIVGSVCRDIRVATPDAVVIVVSNPLDEMTHHAWRTTGFPATRVIGMAGLLDSARFRSLVALEPEVSHPGHVHAMALGSHGDEMVVPLSIATVDGQPIRSVLPADRLAAIVDRTRASGAEVVGLLGSGSAYLTPGTAAAQMALAVVRDTREVVPAAVLADGAYGIGDVYVGLPARLGRGGLVEIVDVPLVDDELAALRTAAARIAERVSVLQTEAA
jgi:malate dehydrogenase